MRRALDILRGWAPRTAIKADCRFMLWRGRSHPGPLNALQNDGDVHEAFSWLEMDREGDEEV
jgi:hypothetical protein